MQFYARTMLHPPAIGGECQGADPVCVASRSCERPLATCLETIRILGNRPPGGLPGFPRAAERSGRRERLAPTASIVPSDRRPGQSAHLAATLQTRFT